MHFIVKLFPEITIKSTPVRRRFTKQLRRNVQRLLREKLHECLGEKVDSVAVIDGWDKLEVSAPGLDASQEIAACAETATVLAHTPGIANFAAVRKFGFRDLENMGEQLLSIWREKLRGRTFCVRAKRNGTHEYNSMDIEKQVGSVLNRGSDSAGVRMQDPDIIVRVEVRDDQCYALLDRQPGLGGFPLGTQDPVLSLVSGGFDSTVASYLTIKRGLLTHFCFFNLGGRAHELGVKEVSYYLWRKFAASHNVQFISVPFEDVVGEILQNIHHSQMGVVLKRMMLRVATRIAAEMRIQALVTGESVAQVSSQTLANLSVIDGVTETLVLRPLITMDKGEIIEQSRLIGTEEFAANMPEYCGVISVKPTTRARRERIEREENGFDFNVLERAFEGRVSVPIGEVESGVGSQNAVSIVEEVSQDAVVIDIRHPDEVEKKPLVLAASTIKQVPFYQLSKVFPGLDSSTHYLLYCDKGVMSQLHAAHLHEEGCDNVGVFRPK